MLMTMLKLLPIISNLLWGKNKFSSNSCTDMCEIIEKVILNDYKSKQ